MVDRLEGWFLGWLFVAALGIIWGVLLLPRMRRGSPSTSVEDFGRTMDLLAETNRRPGRWVLIPRRGERFLGRQDRSRARVHHRRRQVVTILLELIAVTFLIGLVPPLRPMMLGTVILCLALGAYLFALSRVRVAQGRPSAEPRRAAATPAPPVADGGRLADVTEIADAAAHRTGGYARRRQWPALRVRPPETDPFANALSVTEDDVHVVVRRLDEVDLEELRAAAVR